MLTVLLNTTATVNNDNGYKNLLSLIHDMRISAISLYVVGIAKNCFNISNISYVGFYASGWSANIVCDLNVKTITNHDWRVFIYHSYLIPERQQFLRSITAILQKRNIYMSKLYTMKCIISSVILARGNFFGLSSDKRLVAK